MTKSTGNSKFGHIYGRNPSWKNLFFVQCTLQLVDREMFSILNRAA